MKTVTFRPASGGSDKGLVFEAERLPPLVQGHALSRFGGRPRRRGVSAASMAEVLGKTSDAESACLRRRRLSGLVAEQCRRSGWFGCGTLRLPIRAPERRRLGREVNHAQKSIRIPTPRLPPARKSPDLPRQAALSRKAMGSAPRPFAIGASGCDRRQSARVVPYPMRLRSRRLRHRTRIAWVAQPMNRLNASESTSTHYP
jgi:hypothetical protein